eukprot:1650498-Pyramimonas_sp.AAC.1
MYSAAPEKGLRMRGDIVMDNQEYVGKSTSRRRFQKNVGLAESDSGEEEDGDDGEEVENEDQSDDENEQAEQDRAPLGKLRRVCSKPAFPFCRNLSATLYETECEYGLDSAHLHRSPKNRDCICRMGEASDSQNEEDEDEDEDEDDDEEDGEEDELQREYEQLRAEEEQAVKGAPLAPHRRRFPQLSLALNRLNPLHARTPATTFVHFRMQTSKCA